ncbi:MAG: DUF2384 domain-containing protein [Alphaproteobacteria bacterium]|nr:DUF2384 domain-containing protein [Alphaproteobacteria bacterium]
MIEALRIAAVLGGRKTLRRTIRSLADLDETVSAGLPRSALEACMGRVIAAPAERRAAIYRVVPKATYARRTKKLGLAASERTARLARLIATAEFVWDDAEDAHIWLLRPHPELGGKSPLDAATSELGAARAELILWHLAHGIAA